MNRLHKREIKACLHFRDKRMSVLSLVHFNMHMLLRVATLAAAAIGLMIYLGIPLMAWIFGSAYIAVVLRDLGYFLKWSLTWPVMSELLDWPKIERLALENGIAT